MSRKRSAHIAAARGAFLPHLTRDAVTLDITSDLSALTAAQLSEHRSALLSRLAVASDPTEVDALVERADATVAAISTVEARTAAVAQRRAALLGANVTVPANGPAPAAGGGTPPTPGGDQRQAEQTVVTPGEAFVRSEGFQAMLASGSTRMDRVEVNARAVMTTDYPSVPTRVPGILQPTRDTPLTVLDMIDRQTLGTNYIEWVQEIAAPGGAAEVAEGALKPESTWDVQLVQSAAATIAHWLDISRQTLQDETTLQGYINGRMGFGIEKRLNAQVLNGNGTAPNLRGILQTVGIGAYTGLATDDYLVQIRKARTVAELSEYIPDAVALHPSDWEKVELSTNDNGTFRVAASVADGANQRVWGLAVISTTNIAQGTALVGGFREGATLWERTGIEIYVTDSDDDKFKKNILTLLAEKRAALSVWRPKAFVKVTLTPYVPAP